MSDAAYNLTVSGGGEVASCCGEVCACQHPDSGSSQKEDTSEEGVGLESEDEVGQECEAPARTSGVSATHVSARGLVHTRCSRGRG